MTYPEFIREWRDDGDFCTAHTSGSTGSPKEIRLPKRLMEMSARRTLDFFGIESGRRIHSCISPDFIGGKMMAVRAEIGSLTLTWEAPSNRPQLPDEEDDKAAPALVAVVPSQMIHLLSHPRLDRLKSTVWLIGGSAIDPQLRRRIADAGLNAWESYGMTETSSHIALRRVEASPGPFYPLQGVEISADPRGCLRIRQPHMDEITTNDIVEILPDGGFRILGRADNVIITGGKKVQPEAVEATMLPAILQYGVAAVMLTSLPDEKWGRRLLLLVEPERDCRTLPDADLIMAEARRRLRPHEVPKEIRIVDSLPRTANGKLRRAGGLD